MTRRGIVVIVGLLGALFVGGVSQTFLWRWGLGGVAGVTGSQFMWVLLTFGIAWAGAEGRLVRGGAAGALTGLALIASYYAMQWVADGSHSATAQFSKTGGPAWSAAAIGGGAVMGLLGALASTDSLDRPRLKAIGIVTPAVLVGAGPVLWVLTNSAYLDLGRVVPAAVVFALVAGLLLTYAVRTCGAIPSVQAVAGSVGIGAAALFALLWLQVHGWLYLTF